MNSTIIVEDAVLSIHQHVWSQGEQSSVETHVLDQCHIGNKGKRKRCAHKRKRIFSGDMLYLMNVINERLVLCSFIRTTANIDVNIEKTCVIQYDSDWLITGYSNQMLSYTSSLQRTNRTIRSLHYFHSHLFLKLIYIGQLLLTYTTYSNVIPIYTNTATYMICTNYETILLFDMLHTYATYIL